MNRVLLRKMLVTCLTGLLLAGCAVYGPDVAEVREASWWQERFRANREAIERSGGAIDLVFMGDSITHYWDVGEGSDTSTEIVDLRKRYTILNCGYGGDRVRNLRWRAEHGELDGYQAKLVMVLIGTNDLAHGATPEEVSREIRSLVDFIRRKQAGAKILLLSLLPRGKSADDRCYAAVRKTNELLDRMSFGRDVIRFSFNDRLVDATGATRAELYDEERVHLMDEGYVIWRQAVEPIFREACGK